MALADLLRYRQRLGLILGVRAPCANVVAGLGPAGILHLAPLTALRTQRMEIGQLVARNISRTGDRQADALETLQAVGFPGAAEGLIVFS